MSIKLGKYSFTGPVESIDQIRDRSGEYAIVCKKDNELFLLDVGESTKLRTRIENYDRKECWITNCNGQLIIYVHYTPFAKQKRRIVVENEIREQFQPGCKTEKKIWFSE